MIRLSSIFDHGVILRVELDRKSTRLNSSHANISYAVFCLKKKKESLDAAIRDWSVYLRADYSPTKFKPEVMVALKNGTVFFFNYWGPHGDPHAFPPDGFPL